MSTGKRGKPDLRVVTPDTAGLFIEDGSDPLLKDCGPAAKARAKAPPKRDGRQRAARYIGCPLRFLVDVCRRTKGRDALVVALHVYRRTQVLGDQTVTVDVAELAELGVDRRRGNKVLRSLNTAGIVQLRRDQKRKTRVTLLWRP